MKFPFLNRNYFSASSIGVNSGDKDLLHQKSIFYAHANLFFLIAMPLNWKEQSSYLFVQKVDFSGQGLQFLFISLLLLVSVVFLYRELFSRRKLYTLKFEIKNTKVLNESLHRRIKELKSENEIQFKVGEEQRSLIQNQTIELDKHRQQLEKIVESRTGELLIAKERAEESDRLKSAFLENISHEIRTPMNAIIGFSSLLDDNTLEDSNRQKFIHRINHNCQMLLRLIDDILDMSKIHAEQMSLNKSRFSVNKLLKNIFADYLKDDEDIKNMKVKFVLDKYADNKDYFLYSDAVRLTQVFNKLISNALKYTDDGSIHFGYKPQFASEFEKEPTNLQFYVSDTGIGIAAEKSEFIFDRFSKIEDDNSKLYRGAGLGLYISKRLVSLMGGDIWVNSSLNEGSTFYFTIPYFDMGDVKPASPKKELRTKAKKPLVFDWRNKVILVAEDEKSNFIYLNEIIRRTGATVIEAHNGLEAVAAVRDNPNIHLVLMDLLMPELDGFSASSQIKQIRPNISIIAQTAFTLHQKQKERCLESGCDGYISKPYEPLELLELMNNFI